MRRPPTSLAAGLALALAALVGLLAVAAQDFWVRSDIDYFLPVEAGAAARSPAESYLLDTLTDADTSNLLLLRFAGDGADDTAALSRRLHQALSRSDLFVSVHNGRRDAALDSRGVYFRYRYLVNRDVTAEDFTAVKLGEALQTRLEELQSGAGLLFRDLLLRDPTRAYVGFLRQAQQAVTPGRYKGVWFNEGQTHGLLLARIAVSGFELTRQRRALQRIEAFFAEQGVSDYTVSGPGVFALAIRDKVEHILSRYSLIALVLIAVLILFAFRSLRALVIVFLPMGIALLAAGAIVALAYGGIHGITLGFGITLLGVAIDYPVHMLSHGLHGGHRRQVIRRIGPTLLIGVVTTALSYLAFWGTGIAGLDELAVFTMIGLFVALAATLFIVPVLMPQPRPRAAPPGQSLAAPGVTVPPRLIGVILFAMTAFAVGTLLKPVTWEDNLADLSPVPQSVRATDKALRDELRIPDVGHLFVIHDTNLQRVLRETEQLDAELAAARRAGVVEDVRAVSTFLPSHDYQLRAKQRLPAREPLTANLNEAARSLPFKVAAFNGFIEDVVQTPTLPPLGLEQVRDSRFGELIDALLEQRSGRWYSTVQLIGVEYQALAAWLEQRQGLSEHFVNLAEVTARLLEAYRQLSLERLAAGVGLVVVLLMLLLRRVRLSLLIGAQLVLTIAVTVSILALAGVELMVFHLLSLLLIVGISLDYSLFFARHMDEASRGRTLYGILIAFTTTIIAFGVLMFTEIPVLVAIGQTVFTGVCVSLLMAWLVVNKLRTSLRNV